MRISTSAVDILGPKNDRQDEVLTPEAIRFVAELQREFGPARQELLARRRARQAELDGGKLPDFLPHTRRIRECDWRVQLVPRDLQDRRVEITGPVERKMMINALNSGAQVFMADFEDANSPTRDNVFQGQVNLLDAVKRRLEYTSPEGREYRLNDQVATLMVRPRGWHLVEKHVEVDGEPISASLLDFGLFLYNCAWRLVYRGSGPYFYLPKLESHLEARLWNDVFTYAENRLWLPHGTIKATVLIENALAAFEMDEILYELREHSAGLNAGRWDYIFSIIRKLRGRPEFVLPDRAQVTMTVPFMHAYAGLLVKTCHRRGAFAIGGMAAFIPSRRDRQVNENAFAKVREDKRREASMGFDGTWVAHPDLVPIAREAFDEVLGARPNQIDHRRDDLDVEPSDLLDVSVSGGAVTEQGLRNNVRVGILYLESWLRGQGAVGIDNLMEDAATAEISRSQIWQWVANGVQLSEGPRVTRQMVCRVEAEELGRIREAIGPEAYARGRFADAAALFEEVALAEDFVEFLTLPAYDRLVALTSSPARVVELPEREAESRAA